MPPKTPVSIDGNAHDRFRRLDAAQLRADAHRGEEDDIADGAGERGDAVVFVSPMATPMAKSSGRFPKIALPDSP